jgi:hypothetical protein
MPTTKEQFEKLWPIVFLPYFFGPSIASILLTGLVHGRAGPSRTSDPFAQVAGERSLVLSSALDRPVIGDADTLRTFANLPDISPRHTHCG